MSIIYPDNPPKFTGRPVPYDKQRATEHWLKHYINYRYLHFLWSNTDDRKEKWQANKEIGIAERKMSHWRRHPNFDIPRADEGRNQIDKDWKV